MSTRIALPLFITEGSSLHITMRVVRALALAALIFALPYLVAPFRLSQITNACIYAMVIVGLNLLSGFGGQISLGHAAFFGLGAYTTGVLTTAHGVDPVLSFAIAVALCFVVGAAVAFPALRLKGVYVALVTLAVGLIFPALVSRFTSVTGGPAGLFGVSYAPPNVGYFAGFNGATYFHYWLAVAGLLLSCLVVRNLVRSRYGRSVIALRDNETPAIIMGVNRTLARTLMFGTSAGIAGLAGCLFAVTTGILTPDTFSLLLTLYFLAGMIIGGASTLWGPIVGGFVIYYVPVWASDLSGAGGSANLSGVVFGVIIIVITFTLRSGLVGVTARLARHVVRVRPQQPRLHRPGVSSTAAIPASSPHGSAAPTPMTPESGSPTPSATL